MPEIDFRSQFLVLRNAKRALELPFSNKCRLIVLSCIANLFSIPFFYSVQTNYYNSDNWPKSLLISSIFYIACTPLLLDAAFRAIGSTRSLTDYPAPLTIGRAVSIGMRRLPTLFGLMCLLGILFIGGLLLLVVPGLFAMTLAFVAIPVCISENTGVIESIKRSSQLTYGSRWKILGFIILTILVTQLVDFMVGVSATEADNPLYGALIRWGGASLISAFIIATQALAYTELKQIKENTVLSTGETPAEVISPSFSS